jgi:hypothetical protein
MARASLQWSGGISRCARNDSGEAGAIKNPIPATALDEILP